MEPLLVVITVGSLVLASAMAFVAWKLLRQNRERSNARIEALQAFLASPASEDASEPVIAPAMVNHADEFPSEHIRMEPPAPVIAPRPIAAVAEEEEEIDELEVDVEIDDAPEQDWPLPATLPTRHVTPAAPIARRSENEHWDLALRQRRPYAPETRPRTRPHRAARSAPPEELFATPDQRTPSHRSLALVGVAAVMALAIGGVYALYSTDVLTTIVNAASGKKGAATTNAGEAPLELLSLRHTSETGGDFVLTGLVQNPASSPSLKGVVAVVYLFDKEGRFFASGKASLDVPLLASGGEAPFVIKVPASQPVGRYRVGFRQEDGAVVAHVDRRGELPGGTTGDAIETSPTPTAMPVTRRSEG